MDEKSKDKDQEEKKEQEDKPRKGCHWICSKQDKEEKEQQT